LTNSGIKVIQTYPFLSCEHWKLCDAKYKHYFTVREKRIYCLEFLNNAKGKAFCFVPFWKVNYAPCIKAFGRSKLRICFVLLFRAIALLNYTQWAKDCGPRKCRSTYNCARAMHGAKITACSHAPQPIQAFKDRALICVWISASEESSLQIKHAKKLLYQFFDYESHNPWHTRYIINQFTSLQFPNKLKTNSILGSISFLSFSVSFSCHSLSTLSNLVKLAYGGCFNGWADFSYCLRCFKKKTLASKVVRSE